MRQNPSLCTGFALLAALALALLPTAARAANRNLAIVLDTSGSMEQNDPPRYTVQLSQILGDLLDDGDELTVVRMPVTFFFASCADGPSNRLAARLDPADRAGWKRRLDALIHYIDGTHFAAPLRTAAAALARTPGAERMLLVIADAGGLGECDQVLTEELLRLKASGVSIAAINLGGTAGAFDSNPAFSFTTAAGDAFELTKAVALVYQKFLGAKQVQTGRVEGAIRVEIAPYVRQAFLVVAAEGPIGALTQGAGNPGAAAIDSNYRGGGQTQGLDGRVRGYRIVRLERPAAGRWTFTAPGLGDAAGWMLIQESALGVRVLPGAAVPKGVATPLEVELYDQATGRRVDDPGRVPGLSITATVGGRKLTFRDDGRDGDRKAGDGVFTATATFDQAGPQSLPVRLESNLLDRTMKIETRVVDAAWSLKVESPGEAEAGSPVTLKVELLPQGAPTPPASVEARIAGQAVTLRSAGGATYSGSWTPTSPGTVTVDYAAAGGSPAAPVRAPLTVRPRPAPPPPPPPKPAVAPSPMPSAASETSAGAAASAGASPPVASPPAPSAPAAPAPAALPTPLEPGPPPAVPEAPEPWLHRWWPVLVAALGAAVLGIIAYGFWSPYRFPSQLGVVLSPEADMSEGFLYPIRGQRGARSGFFRHARIYVCQDFRLSGRARNAVALLRAEARQVRIAAAAGAAVWRRRADGGWEPLPPGESPARPGTIYRNDLGSLFFELRNA